MLSLLREFLEFYNLQHTSNVLASEASSVSAGRGLAVAGWPCTPSRAAKHRTPLPQRWTGACCSGIWA